MQAEKGYLVIAVNNDRYDYVHMARQLCHSIKTLHPEALVCLATDHEVPSDPFDFVRLLPCGDQSGFCNDWQSWSVSPFRETIKLEADMLVVSGIDHWWTLFRNRDVVISTGARDFYDQDTNTRFYRKVFDENYLPDVYNAITYWRRSHLAMEFWQLVKQIFQNWQRFCTLIRFAPESPDTDLVYAMAAEIIGRDKVTLPFVSYPRITHMKRHVIPIQTSDWTQELIWEKSSDWLRINTVTQWGCFHYHVKDWCVRAGQ